MAWGAGDFFGGLTTRIANVLTALLVIQAVGALLTVALLLSSGESMPGATALAWAAVAGLSGLVGLLCLYLALSRGTMGLVAPASALIAAAVPAMVGIVSGDRTGPLLLLGMLMALMAVVVISLPERRAVPGLTEPLEAGAAAGGSRAGEWLLVLFAGLGFASFYLCVDRAQQQGGGVWWDLTVVRLAALSAAVVATLTLLAVRRAPSLRVTRNVLPLTLLAAVGDTGGNLFYIMARSAAGAAGTLSVTVVLASLFPVSTVVLARVVLHERLSRRRLAGVGLAVGAVALIGLGAAQA